jgi:hypothetical protein
VIFLYAMTLPRMPSLSTPQQHRAISGSSVALEKDTGAEKIIARLRDVMYWIGYIV